MSDADDDDDGPDLAAGIAASDLIDDRPVGGTFDGEPVVLVRHDGRPSAYTGKCTHLEAPLAEGLVVDGTLRCPWHHARFSLATGEAVAAPAFKALQRFAVEERDGRIFVIGRLGTAQQDTAGAKDPGRVVIVGGGAGGHACAEMLTRHGHGSRVTVVSDDPDRPYDRTFCSKQYLIGMVERERCFIVDDAFYRDGGPVLETRRVASIDVAAKEVVLDDGRRLAFDALVLATGGEPQRPKRPGFDRENVHLLRTLTDADALIAAARPGTHAVVVGASFIGLEVAASLTQRDVAVEVVAPDDIPLKKIVGADVGSMIRGVHEERGVRFHLGREACSFDGGTLTLDDDSTIDADFVVIGVGVEPRTALAEAAGLDVASDDDGGGILVDAHLESSRPGIHAIGDVARYPDRHAGRHLRVEHWVHAERQGQFVARRLMGLADRYDDLPFFWSAHFDTGLRYLGHVGDIAKAEVEGSIVGRDFTIRYVDGSGRAGDEAFTTCNRDAPAMAVEAQWEAGPDRREA